MRDLKEQKHFEVRIELNNDEYIISGKDQKYIMLIYMCNMVPLSLSHTHTRSLIIGDGHTWLMQPMHTPISSSSIFLYH